MTHTKESLEAMGPRELDALAAAVVLGHELTWITSPFSGRVFPFDRTEQLELPKYSASLDAAAVLEVELIKREFDFKYKRTLCEVVDPINRSSDDAITASAKARTIAAILAVQEAA